MGSCKSYTCKQSHTQKDAEIERLRAALREVRTLLMDGSRDPLFAIEDALVPIDAAINEQRAEQPKNDPELHELHDVWRD